MPTAEAHAQLVGDNLQLLFAMPRYAQFAHSVSGPDRVKQDLVPRAQCSMAAEHASRQQQPHLQPPVQLLPPDQVLLVCCFSTATYVLKSCTALLGTQAAQLLVLQLALHTANSMQDKTRCPSSLAVKLATQADMCRVSSVQTAALAGARATQMTCYPLI